MFQLCPALYERVALMVITNLKFADLTQDFGDERLTVALLDGLTHLFANNTLPANPRSWHRYFVPMPMLTGLVRTAGKFTNSS